MDNKISKQIFAVVILELLLSPLINCGQGHHQERNELSSKNTAFYLRAIHIQQNGRAGDSLEDALTKSEFPHGFDEIPKIINALKVEGVLPPHHIRTLQAMFEGIRQGKRREALIEYVLYRVSPKNVPLAPVALEKYIRTALPILAAQLVIKFPQLDLAFFASYLPGNYFVTTLRWEPARARRRATEPKEFRKELLARWKKLDAVGIFHCLHPIEKYILMEMFLYPESKTPIYNRALNFLIENPYIVSDYGGIPDNVSANILAHVDGNSDIYNLMQLTIIPLTHSALKNIPAKYSFLTPSPNNMHELLNILFTIPVAQLEATGFLVREVGLSDREAIQELSQYPVDELRRLLSGVVRNGDNILSSDRSKPFAERLVENFEIAQRILSHGLKLPGLINQLLGISVVCSEPIAYDPGSRQAIEVSLGEKSSVIVLDTQTGLVEVIEGASVGEIATSRGGNLVTPAKYHLERLEIPPGLSRKPVFINGVPVSLNLPRDSRGLKKFDFFKYAVEYIAVKSKNRIAGFIVINRHTGEICTINKGKREGEIILPKMKRVAKATLGGHPFRFFTEYIPSEPSFFQHWIDIGKDYLGFPIRVLVNWLNDKVVICRTDNDNASPLILKNEDSYLVGPSGIKIPPSRLRSIYGLLRDPKTYPLLHSDDRESFISEHRNYIAPNAVLDGLNMVLKRKKVMPSPALLESLFILKIAIQRGDDFASYRYAMLALMNFRQDWKLARITDDRGRIAHSYMLVSIGRRYIKTIYPFKDSEGNLILFNVRNGNFCRIDIQPDGSRIIEGSPDDKIPFQENKTINLEKLVSGMKADGSLKYPKLHELLYGEPPQEVEQISFTSITKYLVAL